MGFESVVSHDSVNFLNSYCKSYSISAHLDCLLERGLRPLGHVRLEELVLGDLGVPEELVPELVGRHVDALTGVAGEGQHGVEVHVQVGRTPVPRRRRGSLGAGVRHPHVAQLTAELGQDLLKWGHHKTMSFKNLKGVQSPTNFYFVR